MVSAKAIAVAALASTATALPGLSARNLPICMTSSQAQKVATNFGQLISNYSDDLANKVLTSDC